MLLSENQYSKTYEDLFVFLGGKTELILTLAVPLTYVNMALFVSGGLLLIMGNEKGGGAASSFACIMLIITHDNPYIYEGNEDAHPQMKQFAHIYFYRMLMLLAFSLYLGCKRDNIDERL